MKSIITNIKSIFTWNIESDSFIEITGKPGNLSFIRGLGDGYFWRHNENSFFR